jgi:NADH-ubiquinone oxidoreductase chain 1
MLYLPHIISVIEVVLVLVPALLAVAYVTVAERKTMASMQIKLGPNNLQAFADALKLLLKEYVAPTLANIVLFFIGPVITLIFSLLVTPPKPHSFVSLPVQSKIGLNSLFKRLTLPNVLTSLSIILLLFFS